MTTSQRIQVIDSHTGGEPTRVVISGGPDLGSGSMAERRERLAREHDWLRTAVICEPRGSEVLVGALLCPPVDPQCAAGVIFFNNASYLGMCGHGTIGVAVTLAHLGRIQPGVHRLETPVGVVGLDYEGGPWVTVVNVPSYRHAKGVRITVPEVGVVTGDIAWGGNWFFLTETHGQELTRLNVDRLTDVAWRIRQALAENAITGAGGAEIDHIELIETLTNAAVQSRNFVLCPGRAYDRSPCGTGLSAKLACLVADGKLREGEAWRQQSIIGSVFEGKVRIVDSKIIPHITGSAYVTAESTLVLDPADPLREGIRP